MSCLISIPQYIFDSLHGWLFLLCSYAVICLWTQVIVLLHCREVSQVKLLYVAGTSV